MLLCATTNDQSLFHQKIYKVTQLKKKNELPIEFTENKNT